MPPTKQLAPKLTIQDKLATLRQELNQSLLERREEIDLTLTAIVARTSVLFVGPPGAAKSMTLECVSDQITDCECFKYLLGKFTRPEELFGATDILKLRNEGKVAYVTKGKLPEAHFTFLDEIWNAGPAIINMLNRCMNEREFDNGDGFKKIPLIAMFAASNRHPQEHELNAAYDRWVLRKEVNYCKEASSRKQLLSKVDHRPTLSVTLSLKELEQASKDAMLLPYPDKVKDVTCKIVEEIISQGAWHPSDRRLPLTGEIVRAYAFTTGANQVQNRHLEILKHVLWNDPGDQIERCERIVMKWANPVGHQINKIRAEAEDVMKKGTLGSSEITTKLENLLVQLQALDEEPRLEAAIEHIQTLIDQNNQASIGIHQRS